MAKRNLSEHNLRVLESLEPEAVVAEEIFLPEDTIHVPGYGFPLRTNPVAKVYIELMLSKGFKV